MKKVFQTGLIVTLVLALSLVACKKEATPSEKETTYADAQKKTLTTARLSWEGECPNNFTDEEIEFVGTEHNRLVVAATDNFRLNSTLTLMEALNQVFEENEYSELTQAEFDDIQDRYSVDNFDRTMQ